MIFYLLLLSIISQHRRNQMDHQTIWVKYTDQPRGQKLHESEISQEGNATPITAILYEKLVLFDKMCLEYSFDLKFGIKDQIIKFQLGSKSMSFILLKNDYKQWRSVLCLYLNQKGFHETFKPIKKIGKGNFASVYLVQKIQNKCKYAIKAFSKQAAYSQQNGKQCLIKQIEIMRKLHHHSLMKLEQVFQSDNSLYIVFQLLQGGQLYDKIKQKYQFKQSQIKNMMKDLLEGLKQMHNKGIMHRDLKPQNILLRSKQTLQCVIADFGLAEFANQEEYLFVRCGTPGYVAPQVINIKDMKQRYSPICDIFSLGLIFHVFLFSFSVFRKKTYNQVLAENRTCTFTFQDEIYQNISTQTLDLLKKMLKVNPEQRITAQQALAHPYFKLQQEQINQNKLRNKISVASTVQSQNPFINKKEKMKLDKDSCLQFKLGNENIMKGNNQTVTNVGKTKVSVFGQAMTPGRISKISKFSRPL